MQRVMIVGACGAGKTVLANRLGDLLGLPVLHLDALRYQPDWSLVDDDAFAAAQRRAVTGPRWVIDGNSLATLDIRARAADTIIVLDLHPAICLLGILHRRWRYHGGQHPDGVFDRITPEVVRYVWSYRARHLPRVLKVIAAHGPNATLIQLTRRRDVARFLADARHEHTPKGGRS